MRALVELFGVALVLLTLPGTAELALLTFASMLVALETRRTETFATVASVRRLAIVIPAHNEEALIERCIESVAKCQIPPAVSETCIVVIADNCGDATGVLAAKAGARVIERRDEQRRGKGHALQFAFARLLEERFDALLVLDADSIVESNLLLEVLGFFGLGADGVQTRYLPTNDDNSPRARLRNIALFAFNVLRPLGRDRIGLSCGISGNGFALHRRTLEAVPYEADSIVEDLQYHLSIVRAGCRMRFADRTTVRAEMPLGGTGARTQRARWEGGRVRMIVENAPALTAEVFATPRLLEPLLELLLLPLTIHVAILCGMLAIPLTLTRIYSACALAIVALHVARATVLSGPGAGVGSIVAALPGYFVLKFSLLPAIIRSARSNAEWRRTERP